MLNAKFFLKSIATFSFWRYALFSTEAIAKIFALVGAQYLLMDMADFFSLYTKDKYSRYAVVGMAALAVVWVIFTRRPITRFANKMPGKDLAVEVRIGDLFEGNNDVVVSTNTTFDTDMAGGLIDTNSIQGQVATRFFNANTAEIDRQLAIDLAGYAGQTRAGAPGKQIEYPMGTIARVQSHNRTFYFVAMSRLNDQGNARGTARDIDDALEATWTFIREKGNLRDVSIPLLGTGRGRTGTTRKKTAERIAHSFVEASSETIFCNKLSIVIRSEDAERFSVNLYQIRDYLVQSMHA